jgi:hypothetical protein
LLHYATLLQQLSAPAPAVVAPEDGETEELVQWLEMLRDQSREAVISYSDKVARIARIVELLRQQTVTAALPAAERLRIVKRGIVAGYNLGHHHTCESSWGDPDEVADDYAEEVLQDLGNAPAPAVVPVAVNERLPWPTDGPAVPESSEPASVAAEARPLSPAALAAEPVGEGPSVEDLALIYHECCRGCEFMDQGGFEDAARAVLARWGCPTALPAPEVGEVWELVAVLEQDADRGEQFYDLSNATAEQFTRAAELLQQQESRIANLRSALAESGRATGAVIGDDYSDAFLLQEVPAQVRLAVTEVAIPGEQWHEDGYGTCLWWRFPIEEPPWCGDPRDGDWPGYHTHFTRIPIPLPQAGEGEA